jgi:hypothetical protein
MIDKLKQMLTPPRSGPPPLPTTAAAQTDWQCQEFGKPLNPMEEAILEKRFGQLHPQLFLERFLNSNCMVLTTQEHLKSANHKDPSSDKLTLSTAPVLFAITYPESGQHLAIFTDPSRIKAGGDHVKGFRFGVHCCVGDLLSGLRPVLGVTLNPYTQYNFRWTAQQMEQILKALVRQ